MSMRVGADQRPHRTFEELLSVHLDALYGTALRLCGGSAADAEDLLQEAALRAFRAFRDLRDEAAGRAWLFTILTRTHLNRTRTAARRRETFSGDLETADAFEQALEAWQPSRTPDDLLEGRLLRERLAAALDALEPEMRAVVWLVDVEGSGSVMRRRCSTSPRAPLRRGCIVRTASCATSWRNRTGAHEGGTAHDHSLRQGQTAFVARRVAAGPRSGAGRGAGASRGMRCVHPVHH